MVELLEHLDQMFNTTGNSMVAVNLFNSFFQREDVPVQDYATASKTCSTERIPEQNPINPFS